MVYHRKEQKHFLLLLHHLGWSHPEEMVINCRMGIGEGPPRTIPDNRGLSRFRVSWAGFVNSVHIHFRRSSTMAETKARCHCSVPLCKSNKQRQPYLSFHWFPTELSLRKKWIKAVRRDEGPNFKIKQGSTFVCSQHFSESDYTNVSSWHG